MMIRTAGGPGLVSPIDFNERKTPRFTRNTWIALAIVGAGHAALGVALYYQRFELDPPVVTEGPLIDIDMMPLPKPPIPVVQRDPAPQAPNKVFNELPAPPTTTDVLTAVKGDTPTDSPTISVAEPAPDPVAEAVNTAPTPPTQPPVITRPTWIRQPSADQLMRAYPDRALEAGVGGSAMLNCLVQQNGRVADCRLTSETPGNYAFGRAAQSLTRHFQISPRTVNGAAEGSRVNIAIRFTPPAA